MQYLVHSKAPLLENKNQGRPHSRLAHLNRLPSSSCLHLDLPPRIATAALALLPLPPTLSDTVEGNVVALAPLLLLEVILLGSASKAPLAKSDRLDRRPPKRLVCSAEKLSA